MEIQWAKLLVSRNSCSYLQLGAMLPYMNWHKQTKGLPDRISRALLQIVEKLPEVPKREHSKKCSKEGSSKEGSGWLNL